MLIENDILIIDFVWAISEAVDLISPILNNHHNKVTYIATSIAQEMGLPNREIHNIMLASMLHDIGVFSKEEWVKLLSFEDEDKGLDHHAIVGYELLKDFEPLSRAAELIRYHHERYIASVDYIPVGSYIIHLADRLAILFDREREGLDQAPEMMSAIHAQRDAFHPDALAVLDKLAKMEYFWIEAFSSEITSSVLRRIHLSREIIDMETLRDFAKTLAQIIDFRNRFTSTHSSGVAAVAMELSKLSGFSDRECKMMEIAGFLHDLGKLSVPNEILEKNGALSDTEFNIVRKHTYYTYAILNKIRGLEHIAVWAAHHHERPDGNGYPFHVKGGDFSKLSRIMAVADVVTALTEDRPYRSGMNKDRAKNVLQNMVNSGGLDSSIVELANKNFLHINEVRKNAQQEARKEYDSFHASTLTIT